MTLPTHWPLRVPIGVNFGLAERKPRLMAWVGAYLAQQADLARSLKGGWPKTETRQHHTQRPVVLASLIPRSEDHGWGCPHITLTKVLLAG